MQDIHLHSLGEGGGGVSGGRFFGGGLGGGGGGGDRRMRAVHHHHHNHHNHHPALKCPRCDSVNTKFCYYNNYNLSQPRHFCKTCRRYWTKGGVLRNVPVGGGCRKAKRAKSKQSSTSAAKSSRGDSGGGGGGDQGEGKSNASHSSSESSSVTASNSAVAAASAVAATTAVASAPEVASAAAPFSGFLSSSFNNPKLYGNGIEWSALLGQGSSDGGIFTEIGSFTSLVTTSSNETTPFGFRGGNQQCMDHGLKVEGEMVGGLLDDQTAHVEFAARSLDQNVGFGPLDWGVGPGVDHTLFDLTSTVDHAYWSQSQWTTDQDHGGLYLP